MHKKITESSSKTKQNKQILQRIERQALIKQNKANKQILQRIERQLKDNRKLKLI